MVLDNFRAAAQISEDALVKMGVELERQCEFGKVVEVRKPGRLMFGCDEVILVETIEDCVSKRKREKNESAMKDKASD